MTLPSFRRLLTLKQQLHEAGPVELLQGGLIVDHLQCAWPAVRHESPTALGPVKETVGTWYAAATNPAIAARNAARSAQAGAKALVGSDAEKLLA
jgi:hypothetical protein